MSGQEHTQGKQKSPQLRWFHGFLCVVCSLAVLMSGLITAFEIGMYSDFGVYEDEYEKYDVKSQLSMEMPEIMRVTRYMMSYLRGGEEVLSIEADVDGKVQDFFNEQDRFHMGEVKALFLGGLSIRRISIVILCLALCAVVLTKGDLRRIFPGIYLKTCGVLCGVSALAAMLLASDFNKYFVIFHHIFFDNDQWIFDPAEDYMIRMLPEGLFFDMTMRIGAIFVGMLLASAILAAGARIWVKKHREE